MANTVIEVSPGAVSAFRGNINTNFSNLSGGMTEFMASPAFTGNPTIGGTLSISDNSNKAATTALTYLANSRCMYGICSTEGGIANKVVSISNFILQTGNRIGVLFSNINTVSNVNLNVNGTGNIAVYCGGKLITQDGASFIPSVNKIAYFTYNGSYWILENPEDVLINFTLLASGWNNKNYILTNGAIFQNSKIIMAPSQAISFAQISMLQQANIISTAQSDGSITFTCLNLVPTVDIPILLTLSYDRGSFVNSCGFDPAAGIVQSTTAPSPLTTKIWIDISSSYTNGCIKFYNGNSWVPVVAVYGN